MLWDPRWQSARWGLKWPRRAPGTHLKQTRPLSTPTAGRGEPPRSMPSVCSFKCLYNMRVTVWVFKVPEHPRGKPQVTNRTWSVETQVLVEGTRCFFPEPGDLGRQTEAYCPRAADRFPDGGTGAAARGRLPHESRIAWPPPGFWPHVVWGLCARGQQFLHGGAGSASYRQLRDMSDFSPYLSGNGRFGDSGWFVISAVTGSGPSSPAISASARSPVVSCPAAA